jgi:hypothetical protein
MAAAATGKGRGVGRTYVTLMASKCYKALVSVVRLRCAKTNFTGGGRESRRVRPARRGDSSVWGGGGVKVEEGI